MSASISLCVSLLLASSAGPVISEGPAGGAAPEAPDPAACEGSGPRVPGTTHYFCDCRAGAAPGCVAGDDARLGQNPAAPRRTLAAATARFNTMRPGDTVALCRGGAWDENGGELHNPLCTAARPCTYRDYEPPGASPASPRPRIHAGRSHGFVAWRGGTFAGYRFWNLDVRHTDRGHPDREGPKSFFIANAAGVDICGVNSQGGYIGVQTTPASPNLTVRHSTFRNHGWDAAYVESAGAVFDSNTFVDNGDQALDPGRGGQAHTLYLACNDPGRPCPGVVIRNNVLRTGADGQDGYGQCRGVMLVLRGHLPGVIVENNLILGQGPYGCGAVATSGSWAYTEIHGARITRNRIFWGSGGGGQQMLQVDACIDCEISDNLVDAGGDARTAGLRVPEQCRSRQDPQVTARTLRNTIRNNTILMRGGGIGIDASACDGLDYVVENNAVWTAPGGLCFLVSRPTLAGHPFNLTSAGNHCSSDASPASALWVNPSGSPDGDYRPRVPGALAGKGNPRHHSPLAPASVRWSPQDRGMPRRPPIDAGAFQR